MSDAGRDPTDAEKDHRELRRDFIEGEGEIGSMRGGGDCMGEIE
jgi:hypothetical protein